MTPARWLLPFLFLAHDGGPNAGWYNSLTRPDIPGSSCCQEQRDCKEVPWRTGADGYEALADDEWVKVPDNKVLHNKDNPTGMAVLCYSRYDHNGATTTTIYCFIPASET